LLTASEENSRRVYRIINNLQMGGKIINIQPPVPYCSPLQLEDYEIRSEIASIRQHEYGHGAARSVFALNDCLSLGEDSRIRALDCWQYITIRIGDDVYSESRIVSIFCRHRKGCLSITQE
jgi:hypothetical protein